MSFGAVKKEQSPRIDPSTKNMAHGGYYDLPLRKRVIELFEKMRKNADCELIFHNRGKIWTYGQIRCAYNRAFRLVGLPYTSTHVCRHTGATNFLEATGDPLALQQMGNWSDLNMAMHYGKIMKERAKKLFKK